MSLADVNVTLNIQNNASYPVQINVLGNPYNPLDTSNATTQYRFNLTGFVFSGETDVSIEYKINGAASFSTFTQQLQSQNIEGIVNALNLLNIGYFQTYTELGQTYISTYNDNFVFGQLNVFPSSSILNYQFSYIAGDVKIRKNGIDVYAAGSPNSDNGDISVIPGDSIEFLGNTSPLPTVTNVFILNVTTSTYIYNITTGVDIPFNQTFTILANNSYLVGVTGIVP
jgi:hypothetical protein